VRHHVRARLFDMLGTEAALGRLFRPEEFVEGADRVVVVAAAGLGLALAQAALRPILALAPANLPRIERVAIDGTVMAFAVAAALAVTLLAAASLLVKSFGRLTRVDPGFDAGRLLTGDLVLSAARYPMRPRSTTSSTRCGAARARSRASSARV
jgi:hypothetical protein